MFLPWIHKCELVKETKESHIIKGLSFPHQRILCQTIVSSLTSNPKGTDAALLLSTPTHVYWIIEIIGNTFTLKMEDIEVIMNALKIYEIWLGITTNSQLAITLVLPHKLGTETKFICCLLDHLTFLFDDRSDASATHVEGHIVLCQKALDMFLEVGRKRGHLLDLDTWQHLIRVLIGLTDNLLHSSHSIIGFPLCFQLIRVLFELYLRSLSYIGPRGEHWNQLSKFCKRWVHRKEVIAQWNIVSLCLTERVVKKLYLPSDSGTELILNWADKQRTSLQIDDILAVFAWYRILRVTGHPSHIQNPEVYHTLMIGISNVADVFLDIPSYLLSKSKGQSNIQAFAPPGANSILRLLAPWLFDACLCRSSAFFAGTAAGISCLGNIISKQRGGRSQQLFLPHATRFILSLKRALTHENDKVVAAAVQSCCTLMGFHGTYTLRGIHTIIPFLDKAAERILRACIDGRKKDGSQSKSGSDSSTMQEDIFVGRKCILLRRALLYFISGALYINTDTHFSAVVAKKIEDDKFSKDDAISPSERVSAFPSCGFYNLLGILLSCFRSENDSTNQQIALWLLCTAMQIEMDENFSKKLPSKEPQIVIVLRTLCLEFSKNHGQWCCATKFTFFDCLRLLANQAKELRAHYKAEDAAYKIIAVCCEFIKSTTATLRLSKIPAAHLDALLSAVYGCTLQWLIAAPWILLNQATTKELIATVVDGADLDGVQKPHITNADISARTSARFLLNYLLRHHFLYSSQVAGKTQRSSFVSEKDFFTDHKLLLANMRAFCLGGTVLVSVVEIAKPYPEILVIVRDAWGKYTWKLGYRHNLESLNEQRVRRHLSNVINPISDEEEGPKEETVCNDPLLNSLRKNSLQLSGWCSPSDLGSSIGKGEGNSGCAFEKTITTNKQDALYEKCIVEHQQIETQITEILSATREGMVVCQSPPYDEKHQEQCCTGKWSRMFLSQMGMSSISNWGALVPLQTSKEMLNDLSTLDQVSDRESFQIGVAYLTDKESRGGRDGLSSNTANLKHLNPVYLNFVSLLGKPTGSQSCLSYADYDYELFFNILTSKNKNQESVDAVEDEVLIVWNDAQQQYYPKDIYWKQCQLPVPRCRVYIIIDSLEKGLYRTRVFCEDSPSFVSVSLDHVVTKDNENEVFGTRVLGPLQDGIVVPAQWLVQFVRQTALNATRLHRAYERYHHSFGSAIFRRPSTKREKSISNIVKHYSTHLLPSEFYQSLFATTSAGSTASTENVKA